MFYLIIISIWPTLIAEWATRYGSNRSSKDSHSPSSQEYSPSSSTKISQTSLEVSSSSPSHFCNSIFMPTKPLLPDQRPKIFVPQQKQRSPIFAQPWKIHQQPRWCGLIRLNMNLSASFEILYLSFVCKKVHDD